MADLYTDGKIISDLDDLEDINEPQIIFTDLEKITLGNLKRVMMMNILEHVL